MRPGGFFQRPEKPAAVIVEPIQAEGGVNVASRNGSMRCRNSPMKTARC
jgi:4-aminobutyrate aminotransferase-like enzyme